MLPTVRDASNGTGLRPPGAPPPAPPRSFLAERGEFDRGPARIELRPPGRPLSRPLPQKTLGERRIRSRCDELSAVLPPPRSLWGRVGEGGGPPSRTAPSAELGTLPSPQP